MKLKSAMLSSVDASHPCSQVETGVCRLDQSLRQLSVAALDVEQPAIYGAQHRHHPCAGGSVCQRSWRPTVTVLLMGALLGLAGSKQMPPSVESPSRILDADSVTALRKKCWLHGHGVLHEPGAMASMPLRQMLHITQRLAAGGSSITTQLVSQANQIQGNSLVGRHRGRDSPPAMAFMPLPWLYWILLMPATNSPANLCAAGPHPILPCASASPLSAATYQLWHCTRNLLFEAATSVQASAWVHRGPRCDAFGGGNEGAPAAHP